MIATLLKHWIYDVGLHVLFDQLIVNFQVPVKLHYLGKYWTAIDPEDSQITCWGLCIQQEDKMIVLDSADGEYIVHTDLYILMECTQEQSDMLDESEEFENNVLIDKLNE